jgi:tetratricopeptide (TPR) repeat protein
MFKTGTPGRSLTRLWLVGCAIAIAQHASAQEMSVEAMRATLERNCVTCYGADKAAYLRAARSLETYVERHPEDFVANRLLARIYGEWAFGYEAYSNPANPAEVERLIERRRPLYRELLASTPDDADLLHEYASILEDPKEQLAILEEASTLAPDNGQILMTVAHIYMNLNDRDRSLEYLERAFTLEKTGLKTQYGRALIAALKEAERTQDASRAQRELEMFEGTESKRQLSR